jgi:hypothetical protein
MLKNSRSDNMKNCLDEEENVDFWFKKELKCKVNIKKIKPTPKSITHKKPIKTSISFNKNKIPDNIRYIPAVNSNNVTLNIYVKVKIVEIKINSMKR